MNRPIIFFVHIPKTGGTSISNMIKLRLGNAAEWRVNREGMATDPDKAWYMGHFPYGVHTEFPARKAVYMTILRDPIERLWSHYWSVLRHPNHYLYELAASLGPMQYVGDRSISYENDNTQTRMICGRGYWQDYDPVTAADFELARRNLDRFAVVGLSERLEETATLIYDVMGWEPDPLHYDNIGTNKPEAIPDCVREAMEAVTVYDRQLYTYAVNLFEEQVKHG